MGQTILNRLGVSDEAAIPKADAQAQEPSEAGLTEEPSVSDKQEDVSDKSAVPVIGMDGKTEDGSMPYEILKDRLEWMK